MKNTLLVTMALLSAASQAGVYEVGYGDTLWDIATWFYGNPHKWTQILEANPDLRGAEYLLPGMVLVIPDVHTGNSTSGTSTYTAEMPAGAIVIRSSEPMLSRLQRRVRVSSPTPHWTPRGTYWKPMPRKRAFTGV